MKTIDEMLAVQEFVEHLEDQAKRDTVRQEQYGNGAKFDSFWSPQKQTRAKFKGSENPIFLGDTVGVEFLNLVLSGEGYLRFSYSSSHDNNGEVDVHYATYGKESDEDYTNRLNFHYESFQKHYKSNNH